MVARHSSYASQLRPYRPRREQADQLCAVGLTNSDRIVAAGGTESPTIKGFAGHRNGWIVILAGDGSVERNFAIGGFGFDEVHGLAVTDRDLVLPTGLSDSPNFPTTADAFRHRGGQPTQAFLAALAPENGQLRFSTLPGNRCGQGLWLTTRLPSDCGASRRGLFLWRSDRRQRISRGLWPW